MLLILNDDIMLKLTTATMLQIKGSKADCPIVLVGNKRDEEAGAREVPYTTGETLQVNTRAANHLREVSQSQTFSLLGPSPC